MSETSSSKVASQSGPDSGNFTDPLDKLSLDRKYPKNLMNEAASGTIKTADKVSWHHACSLTALDHQDTRIVEFTKGPHDSLGISIAGGVGSPLGDIPIFIAMMNPVGVAAQTQKLKV